MTSAPGVKMTAHCSATPDVCDARACYAQLAELAHALARHATHAITAEQAA